MHLMAVVANHLTLIFSRSAGGRRVDSSRRPTKTHAICSANVPALHDVDWAVVSDHVIFISNEDDINRTWNQ